MKQITHAIHAVMVDSQHIPKSGFNRHMKYKFSTVEDVIAGTKEARSKHGIAIIPDHQEILNRDAFGKQYLIDIRAHYIVRHTISGEEFKFSILSSGIDSQDKAFPKALTMALKYAYIQLFSLPRGDDPDKFYEEEKKKSVPVARKNKRFIEFCKSYGGIETVRNWMMDNNYPDVDSLPAHRLIGMIEAVEKGAIMIDIPANR